MNKSILRTKLCDLLGIEYPIILAGMGGTAGPTLAAAVSNAGGLGVIGGTGLTPDQLRDWIRQTRRLTSKPFGVDLILPAAALSSGDDAQLQQELPAEHVAFVHKLRQDLGVSAHKAPNRKWFQTSEFVKKQIEIVLEEKPAVFASGLGDPGELTAECHARGMKVIAVVGNVKHARRVRETGVDVVVAQGYEGGGHTGRVGTLALVPQVVDVAGDVPVVAAGGIGDGRGLAAALALGAQGVWVGTAFLLAHEAMVDAEKIGYLGRTRATNENWRQAIIKAEDEDAVVTRVYTGKTMRHLKNKLIETWEKSKMSTLPMPLQGMLIGDLLEGLQQAGKLEYVSGTAGQIAGLLRERKSAQQIVDGMVTQASEVLEGLSRAISRPALGAGRHQS